MGTIDTINSIIDEIDKKGSYYRNGTIGTELNNQNGETVLRELKKQGYRIYWRDNGYCNYWGKDILIKKQKEIIFR